MVDKSAKYIPALRYDWLTSLYDPILKLTLREAEFKNHLVKTASLQPGQRVLDLGCGTATLTLLIKQAQANAEVVGIDGDEKILAIARLKAKQTGIDINLDYGFVHDLPYAESSFDHVFSSLLFHHLSRENKLRTLNEVFRILRPGGQFHLADWGKAVNPAMRTLFFLVQILDGFSTTSDNVNGLLPSFLEQSGMEEVIMVRQYLTIFGTLCLYAGRKPQQR
ncbi:MAG TPA: class I SAM-dependent methyltransferase [Aggregatilineales bacterium]|nr:class I SAM-dependent methyltransferase [Aggregatilineales bacterium]